MFEAAEGRIDFFRLGDDFGTQRGLLVGPDLWRARIGPALKTMADTAKTYGAYYYHHSCGAVRELIPDLIAIGVDVLDPLQVKAAGMDPAALKRDFGEQICFSGGVDQQELLPRGTPGDVRAGVHRLLDAMARDGGFFIGPTHNFQDDIPTANILALYDAARDWKARG
jgi:uroporphyrinogen decarboxylase